MRRARFAFLLLLLVLIGLAGGAWTFRLPLAEALAQRWLTARGIAGELTVTRLDPGGLSLRALRLGSAPAATAERIDLALDWSGLGPPRVADLAVTTATLRLDLTGAGPLLGELQPLLRDDSEPRAAPEAAETPVALPELPFPVTLEAVTLAAQTRLGPAELRLDGRAAPAAAGLESDLTLQGTTPVAVFGGRVQTRSSAQRIARLQADLRFAAEAQGLDGRLVADLGDLLTAPRGRLTADLTAGPRTAEVLAPFLPAALTWEALQLTLDLDGRLPLPPGGEDASGDAGAPADWRAWAAAGDWTAALTLTGERLAWPGRFAGGQLLLALDAAQSQGRLTLLPAQAAELTLPEIDADFLAGLGLPADLRARLAGGGSLRLSPLQAGAPLLTVEQGPAAVALAPALRLGLAAGPGAAAAGLRGELLFDDSFSLQNIDLSEFNLSLSDWRIAGQRLTSAALSGRLSGPPDALNGAFDLSAEGVAALPDGPAAERITAHWPGELRAELPGAPGRDPGGDPKGGRLTLTGPLSLTATELVADGLRLARLAAGLDAQVAASRAGVTLAAPGSLTAEGLRVGPRRVARLRASLEENAATWRPDGALSHRLAGRWAPLELRIAQNDTTLLEAGVEAGRWQAEGRLGPNGYDGSFAIAQAALTLQDPPLHLEGLRLAGPLPPQPERALDLAGRLTHAAAVPLLPPIDFAGTLEPANGGYEIAATGTALGEQVTAAARATLDPVAPSLRARLTLAPIAFAPGGVQPGDLTPVLAELTQVSGALSATLGLRWAASGPQARAEVTLDDLDFGYGEGLRVAGLSGRLELDSLMPLRTAAPQRLTAARLEAGVTMTDLSAELAVAPTPDGGAPELRVIAAAAQALGGSLRLRDGRIDPAANRQEATLVLDGIDVAALLALLDTPDVAATGRLSGTVPIRVAGDTVTIPGGALAAEAPGVLRLTSEAARRALAGGGQSVELLMQALENFQYEELALTLEKPAAGTTLVTLRLLGQNPEVLDGQPFDVNVRLETDLAPLLLALSQALELTEGAVERLWRLQR